MSTELFDRAEEYDRMLQLGIGLSGETKDYFMRGRVRELLKQLPAAFVPRRILDFGCGLGEASAHLADCFPQSAVVGVDTAVNALHKARELHGSRRVSFRSLDDFNADGSFDLCYVNGVFHHIPPGTPRRQAVTLLRDALAPGGQLFLFENNPWNPGTRLVMARIPFDRDAVPLSIPQGRHLLRVGGFSGPCRARTLFYFPKMLGLLRVCEPWLARLPLGAQYCLTVTKQRADSETETGHRPPDA